MLQYFQWHKKQHQQESCLYPAIIVIVIGIILLILSLGIPWCGGGDDKEGASENALTETNTESAEKADPEADTDADGIPDSNDNCPAIANSDQHDSDDPPNGIGDACQDSDNDGIIDTGDNCDTVVNPDQANSDDDLDGDACDTDKDNDSISDSEDPCPYNPENTCNPDIDKDEDDIPNDSDNCPDIQNHDQIDSDGDGIGDVCDPDRDGDGFDDANDNCPLNNNPDQADDDNDKIGNVCDTYDDRQKEEGDDPDNNNEDQQEENATTDLILEYTCANGEGSYECFKIYCPTNQGTHEYCGQLIDNMNSAFISGNNLVYAEEPIYVEKIKIKDEIIERGDIMERGDLVDKIIERGDMSFGDIVLAVNQNMFAEAYTFNEIEPVLDINYTVNSEIYGMVPQPKSYEEMLKDMIACMKRNKDILEENAKEFLAHYEEWQRRNIRNREHLIDHVKYEVAYTQLEATSGIFETIQRVASVCSEDPRNGVVSCTSRIQPKITTPASRIISIAAITNILGFDFLGGSFVFPECIDCGNFISLLKITENYLNIDNPQKNNLEYKGLYTPSQLDNFKLSPELKKNVNLDGDIKINLFERFITPPEQCLSKSREP